MNLDEAERIASGMTDKVPTLPADVTPEQLADAIMPGFSRTADEATAAAAATSAPHAGAGGNAGAGAAGAASDADNAGSDRAGESDAVAGVEVDGEGEPGDGRQVSAEELCVVCGAVRRRRSSAYCGYSRGLVSPACTVRSARSAVRWPVPDVVRRRRRSARLHTWRSCSRRVRSPCPLLGVGCAVT